ncbi:MAG: sodium/solute symporter [Cellvibrionales bacterium]|nr:sodium/solute symporter [Cellvibrionales bacterium]
MNFLDYFIVAIYLAGMLGLGLMMRKQSSETSYFLGDKSLNWFPLALSTMATQLSAISFISAPAFVGLREGGGLKWLTYEFAVPLAMIFVMFVIAPALYRAKVVSIYDFLERRFGRSSRLLISALFQIVRSFSTGIMVYACAIVLQAVLGIPFWQSIVGVGVVALIYSTTGGMKAVVYSDAIQMVLIFGGIILVAGFALHQVGGFGAWFNAVEPARLFAVDFSSFGFGGDEFGFLPMLFGGFVLYVSYYGCDQTQTQRILSARDMPAARRLLLANGLLRFPLVLIYCFAGLVVGVAVMQSPDLLAQIPADRPDFMMPVYIVEQLPHGLIGLLLVAIMAAAMSSFSSTMNSLAAVTLEDIRTLGLKFASPRLEIIGARALSVGWGLLIIVLSFFAGSIAPTVIEAINKVGSALYGPILGVFGLAILTRNRSAVGVNAGLLVGLALNLYFWKFVPELFWMWWNLIGLLVTLVVAVLVGFFFPGRAAMEDAPAFAQEDRWNGTAANRRSVGILAGYFGLIVAISVALGTLAMGGEF